MAGENNHPKSSSATNTNTNKSSSSDHRKSRWQSSSCTPTTTATTTTNPPSSQTPSKKPPTNSNSNPNSTPPSRPSSNKPTPKHALNNNNNNNNNNSTPNLSSQPPPFPFSPPPQPTYGFHMLDRRTIVLADGTVRSYFALPLDYQDFSPPPPRPPLGRFWPSHDLAGGPPDGPLGSMSMKRKFGFGNERDRERDGGSNNEFARQKQQVLQYGNAGPGPGVGTGTGTSMSSPFKREDEFRNNKYMRIAGGGGGFGGGSNNNSNNNVGSRNVDPAVMKGFLNFVKVINENANQRKNYLENGKHGPLQCLACARSSKEFPDVHALIIHAYNSENADLHADHLGLHRAICVLMGWNYLRAPDNSRAYQLLPPEEAAAYQDDLIMWPPMVIINNTNTGKGKDGRMEGLGNKAMDSKLRDLGFSGGKSKSLYCRDGHLGITLIKFPSEQSGLKEAMRLADHFEKEHHGRRDWARVKSTANDRDEESNPNLVMVDQRTGERRRILYGYLATVSDLDKVDYETRKKVVIESKHEKLQPSK